MGQTKLASLRRYHDISQEKMGNLLDISRESYANKESGKTQFKVSEMFIISHYFDKKPEDIFLPPDFIKHEVMKFRNKEEVN